MSIPSPTPPVIEPVPDDGVRAVTVGLGLWLVALAGCLVFRDVLADRAASWWTWTAVSGLVLGAILLTYTRRRARVYREHAARNPGEPQGTTSS